MSASEKIVIVTIPAAAEVKGESKVKSKLRQVNKRILTLLANDPALPGILTLVANDPALPGRI